LVVLLHEDVSDPLVELLADFTPTIGKGSIQFTTVVRHYNQQVYKKVQLVDNIKLNLGLT